MTPDRKMFVGKWSPIFNKHFIDDDEAMDSLTADLDALLAQERERSATVVDGFIAGNTGYCAMVRKIAAAIRAGGKG